MGAQDVHPTGLDNLFLGSPNKALKMLGFVPQSNLPGVVLHSGIVMYFILPLTKKMIFIHLVSACAKLYPVGQFVNCPYGKSGLSLLFCLPKFVSTVLRENHLCLKICSTS